MKSTTSSSGTRIQKLVLQWPTIILVLVIWSSEKNNKPNAPIYRKIMGSHLCAKSWNNNNKEQLHNIEMVWWDDGHP